MECADIMRRQYSTDSDTSQGLSPKRTCRKDSAEEDCIGELSAGEEDSVSTMATTSEQGSQDTRDALLDIKKTLLDLKESQETMKKSLESRLEAVTSTITANINSLRDEIYVELGRLENKIKGVENKIVVLEEKQMDQIPKQDYPVETSVVIINWREEVDEDIQAKCTDLLQNKLGMRDMIPMQCVRLRSRNTKPGVVKLQFRSKQEKIDVLRKKHELRKLQPFKHVYIRSAQSHEERLMRQNLEFLMKELPNGNELRLTGNGRLVRKTDDSSQAEGPGSSQEGRGSSGGASNGV